MWRPGKVVVLGLILSLAIGLAASAAAAKMDAKESVRTITIPVGHIGDRVVYDIRERAGDSWLDRGYAEFRVNYSAAAHRDDGSTDPAIVLDWNLGPNRPISRIWIDLATRNLTRTEAHSTIDDATATYSDFGPRLEAAWFKTREGTEPLLQGATLRVGDDLTHETRDRFTSFFGFLDDGARLLEYQSRVALQGDLAGTPVFGVRTEGLAEFKIPWRSDWDRDERTPLLSAEVSTTSLASFTRTEWVAADSPYPLLVEDRVEVVDDAPQEIHRRLAKLESGSRPIPWAPPGSLPSSPNLERGPSHGRIDEGLGFTFPYRMNDALDAIRQDLSLVQFRAWSQLYPVHFVIFVSATTCYAQCGVEASWIFTFGVPQGQAIMVVSHRTLSTGEIRNIEFPPGLLHDFAPESLPSKAITLGQIEEIWKSVASPEYVSRGLNFARFGSPFRTSPTGVPANPAAFKVLDLGWANRSYTMQGQGTAASIIQVDVLSGEIILLTESTRPGYTERIRDFLPVSYSSVSSVGPAAPASAGSLAGVKAGAWVAASVFAVFLATYLFPVLKFLVADAWGTIPSFARVGRAQALEHRTRGQLLSLVRQEPGVSPPELHKAVGGGWSTIVYHLRVLEKHGLVSSLIDGRHKRFFPRDTIDWSRRGQLAALRNKRTHELYKALNKTPGALRSELAHRMGLSIPAVLWHLRRLRTVGLAGFDRDGFRIRYYSIRLATPQPSPRMQAGMEVA